MLVISVNIHALNTTLKNTDYHMNAQDIYFCCIQEAHITTKDRHHRMLKG